MLNQAKEEEVEEATPEEKLHIAQHYLLCSPPGQISDVLADVRKLMPDGLLSDAELEAMSGTGIDGQYLVIPANSMRGGSTYTLMLTVLEEGKTESYLKPIFTEEPGTHVFKPNIHNSIITVSYKHLKLPTSDLL